MNIIVFIFCCISGLCLVATGWSLLTLHYIDLHYDYIFKRIEEIYGENMKRINAGNYNLIDYSIVDDEPSPYWVVRVNQALGLW